MPILGCTYENAENYEQNAEDDDGSCNFIPTNSGLLGCTYENAENYEQNAEDDDGSCNFIPTNSGLLGCTYENAENYEQNAEDDNGSCKFDNEILGCTDKYSINYNINATKDDGRCQYYNGCIYPNAINFVGNISDDKLFMDVGMTPNKKFTKKDFEEKDFDKLKYYRDNLYCRFPEEEEEEVEGCTYTEAKNYNKLLNAKKDDGSCKFEEPCILDNIGISKKNNDCNVVKGCTYNTAINYNSKANIDNNTCRFYTGTAKNIELIYKLIIMVLIMVILYYIFSKSANE